MYHPKDTVELWKAMDKRQIDNLWYKLNYFQVKDIIKIRSGGKLELIRLAPSLSQTANNADIVQQFFVQRLENFIELDPHYEVRIMDAVPESLILLGMGAEHVRETSLTLHQTYGVPYFPASSLKGVVRNWAVQAFANGDEESLLKGIESEAEIFREIFGTQENRGLVQFYDSFFEDGFILEKDIITPHFGQYYRGDSPGPSDRMSPIIINFLGIKAESMRIFYTVNRKAPNMELLANTTSEWLKCALTELGIGGKTTSGYGKFETVRDVTDGVLTDLLKEKRIKIEQERERLRRKRKQEKLEAYLATLTEGERVAYKIDNLGNAQAEIEASKSDIYNEVLALPAEEGKIAAQALRRYWQNTGDWRKPSRKQREKNRVIAELIN